MVLIPASVFHVQDQSEHKRSSRVLGKSTVFTLAVTRKYLLITDQYLLGQLKTSELDSWRKLVKTQEPEFDPQSPGGKRKETG